ncbi:Glutaredoxin-C11 [Capsicum annuum]|nr:Glutaredoxin-C11 [Capsicum annuum]
MDRIGDLASKKAAVIFTKSSCFMCHSIKALFYDIGASPAIHELDQDPKGKEMEKALRSLGCNPSVPAVFIGGKFVGSSKDIISLQVDGSLKQMLIDAKAICLLGTESKTLRLISLNDEGWKDFLVRRVPAVTNKVVGSMRGAATRISDLCVRSGDLDLGGVPAVTNKVVGSMRGAVTRSGGLCVTSGGLDPRGVEGCPG